MKICFFFLLLFVCECALSQSNVPARANEVVINEIFADPNPSVGLPPVEFVELWNTTGRTISLKDWLYSDASSTFKFLNDSIRPYEYLILCARSDTSFLKKFGRYIGLSPWPSLNNSADNLSLKDPDGKIISSVDYIDTWYQDAIKKNGGFTLELIDPNAVCKGIKNWQGSNDSAGGTPGRQNSVYKMFDNLASLQIVTVDVLDSISILLKFNRYIDGIQASDPRNYKINNGVGFPDSIQFLDTDFSSVVLKFDQPLARGIYYKITIDQVTDCSGNIILSQFGSFEFLLPKKINKSDVLISEILFNPRPAGVDFVEIFNRSIYTLDLNDLYISNVPYPDTLKKGIRINTKRLWNSGEYIVLTSDPEKIKNEYRTKNPDAFLKIIRFPAYNNEKGTVSILSNNILIDQFSYTEKMHFAIIKNPEGVSLERLSFEKSTEEPGNFQSASASAGFATPGYKNSQSTDGLTSKDEFELQSSSFSPDNDGFEDLMQLRYKLSESGFVANVTIYNSNGTVILKLYKNFTLATQGLLEWDGKNEASEINPPGIYLIYAELFNAKGVVKKFRKTVVLAKKLN